MRTLVLLSIALVLGSACHGAAAPNRPAQSGAAGSLPSPKPLLEPGDFRSRFVEVAKRVTPAVVTVTVTQKVDLPTLPFGEDGFPFDFFFGPRGPRPHGSEAEPRRQERTGTGSGIIIDEKGTILTNNHVVEGADELKVVLHNDKELRAKVVGTDPKTDIAVIRIDADALKGEKLVTVPLGHSSGLQVGEWVMAIGAPFGLKQTVSAGIVSALGRGHMGITDYEDFIQTDAAINPGNSGGPLVNLEGELVGVNTAIASRTGGNQGIGFAVPIDMARQVLDQLIANGSVTRGYVGLMIGDLTPELAESFQFAGHDGVLVQDVTADGPGAAAGIKPGDIIYARDKKPVDDVAAFRNGIASTAPGTTTTLEIWRDGKAVSVQVKLGKLPGEPTQVAQQAETQSKPRWGIALSDLPPDARTRLGLEGAQGGALIAQVEPGSPAQRAGLAQGDVILEVGSAKVHSASEAQSKLAAASRDKPLRLRIVREGRSTFVIVPPGGDE